MMLFEFNSFEVKVKVRVQFDTTPTVSKDQLLVVTEIDPAVTVTVPMLSCHANEDKSEV